MSVVTETVVVEIYQSAKVHFEFVELEIPAVRKNIYGDKSISLIDACHDALLAKDFKDYKIERIFGVLVDCRRENET